MGLFGKRKYKSVKIYSEKILVKGEGLKQRSRSRISAKIKPGARIKEAKPPKRWLYKFFFVILLTGGFLYFVFFSNLFKVKRAIVLGNKNLSKETIEAKVPFGSNIFLFSSESLEEEFQKSFPEISEIIVYKGLPSSLKIFIAEREPVLIWQSGSDLYLVDRLGVAYKKLDLNENSSLLKVVDSLSVPVSINERVAPPAFISFLLKVNDLLREQIQTELKEAYLKGNTFDLELLLDKGFRVFLDTNREPEPQVLALSKILKEKSELIHEYVDLRIPGFVYLK